MRANARFAVNGLRAVCGSTHLDVVNMSVGGMFLASRRPPTLGEKLVLDVEIDGQTSIRVCGTVIWRNDPTKPQAPHLPSGFGFKCQDVEIPTRVRPRERRDAAHAGDETNPPSTK